MLAHVKFLMVMLRTDEGWSINEHQKRVYPRPMIVEQLCDRFPRDV